MIPVFIMYFDILLTSLLHFMITQLQIYTNILKNKSAKWHCGRHTLICKKIVIKKT